MARDKKRSLESQQDKEPIQQTISWAGDGRTPNVKDRCKIQVNEILCHLRGVVVFGCQVCGCSSTSLVVVVGLPHLSTRDFTLQA